MTAPAADHDKLHEKWSEWLEQIKRQVYNMFHNRAIWRDMDDALRNHEGGIFSAHYTDLYIAGQVMALRRIADAQAHDSTISLGRLLGDLHRNPTVMSRDRYVRMYTADNEADGSRNEGVEQRGMTEAEFLTNRAKAEFDSHFGDANGQFDLSKNQNRVERLAAASRHISSYADRLIAHIDSKGLLENPTYADLDAAIDEVGELLREIALLLGAEGLVNLEPITQDDWKWPFRQALF